MIRRAGGKQVIVVISVLLIALAVVYGAWRWNTRPTVLRVDAGLPPDFPENGFSHDVFEVLLRRHVDSEGHVAYSSWRDSDEDMGALDTYLAAVAAYSPENAPDRFASANDRLAYWMYAYNAFVIKAVLDRWPLGSVTDVQAPVEIIRGLGFFYTLRFIAGGKEYSLYSIENDKVRKLFKDPRIHFVLNCGSESCPVLRPELPTGDALEPFLDEATRKFVSEERNVYIDHADKRIVLSAIFKWYKNDFVNDLKRRRLPSTRGVIDYIIRVAPKGLSAALEQASDYAVTYHEYDWSVNETAENKAGPKPKR